MATRLLRLVVLFFVLATCQADLLQSAQGLPACSRDCLLETIPDSACGSVTNTTCFCTQADAFTVAEACAAARCTIAERLSLAKFGQEACDRPIRERRADIPVLIILDLFALACIGMRVWVRYTADSKIDAEDIVGVSTLLVYLAFIITGLFVRITAIGFDAWQLNEQTMTDALKVIFVNEFLCTAVLGLCRVGILLFLKRVFANPRFRIICWVVITWIVITTTVVIFLRLFQCLPLQYNWEGWKGDIDNYRCLDVETLSLAIASLGLIQNVVILLLPLPMLLAQLNMRLNQRLLTLFMFSLGIFVVAISGVRLRCLVEFAKSLNLTWDSTDMVAWTSAEASLSVVILCLPAAGTLLVRYVPQLFEDDDPSSRSGRKGSSRKRGGSYADIARDSSDLESSYGAQDTSIELLNPTHIASKSLDKQWIRVEETFIPQKQGVHLVPDDLDPDLGPETVCAAEPVKRVTKDRRFWRRW
ncbi:hypothetical protein F4779DRAFT_342542 [Xylariaceae sp. FL0662B]|nr:hypothetical protein F4779DRAFT_342542 [Xylariaceae sp. FL0662B]